MIKIIENGKYRKIECSCGCKFSFDLTDVIDEKIKCPECGNENKVTIKKEVANQ